MGRVLLLLMLFTANSVKAQETNEVLRVLVTVGGTGFNTQILRVLESMESVESVVRNVEEHPVVFTSDALQDVDAVLMYHRDNVAEHEERTALLRFIERGGGVVVLHHAIANYPAWEPWWRRHVGGLYVLPDHPTLPPSRYFYAFDGVARATGEHEVTRRLGGSWRYADESYSDLWISDHIHVLLSTTAFGSSGSIAWLGPSDSKRVVFIQPGHADRVMADSKFQYLIEDSLRWSARVIEP